MKKPAQTNPFKISIALMVCVLLVYTSCQKTQVTKTTTTQQTAPSPDDIAKQIATNFYKGLTGGYSGININDGIHASLNISTDHSTHALSSMPNPLCGYTIDTSYNAGSKRGDTVSNSSGSFKFTYTCTSGTVNGYTSAVNNSSVVTDSVTFRSTNSIAQNYVVVATDNTYKTVLTNGTINTESNYGILGKNGSTAGFYFVSAQYVMSNVKVDVSKGIADAVSGYATFNALLINEPPTTPQTDGAFFGYRGSITYLGSYMARVSINVGNNQYKNYLVNMLTGVTTAM